MYDDSQNFSVFQTSNGLSSVTFKGRIVISSFMEGICQRYAVHGEHHRDTVIGQGITSARIRLFRHAGKQSGIVRYSQSMRCLVMTTACLDSAPASIRFPFGAG